MKTATEFYDETYFKRKLMHGKIQGQANLFKFVDFTNPNSKVVDFGCGDGFLLDAVTAADKIGVEINPTAIAHAKGLGLKVYPNTSSIENGWADVVISNHALEHVEDPISAFREFSRILKVGGQIVIVTPYDSVSSAFRDTDPDFHLFGWSPSNLGNLAKACGFKVLEAKEIRHRWPPKWNVIWSRLGPAAFHASSRLWARIRTDRTQVRLVAQKPV